MNELKKIIGDGEVTEKKIQETEDFLKTLPDVKLEVKHHFCNGMYARELFIPAGTILTGKIHKTEHLCMMSGDIYIVDVHGKRRVTGTHVFKSEKGDKRVGLTYSDTVFTTFHVTDETNIDMLESQLVADTYEEYHNWIGSDDFGRFMLEFGFTEEVIKPIVENEADQIDFPYPVDVEKRESKAHGFGMFATKQFNAGYAIGPVRLEGKRTPLGRYTNHSGEPNTMFVNNFGDLHMVAIKDIKKDDELFVDYRQAAKVNGWFS